MWAKIDKFLSDWSDHHMPVLIGVFIAGGFLAWFHRLDQSFVEYAAIVVGAITGHSIWSKKSGDSDGQ